jgi:hypothetical protein
MKQKLKNKKLIFLAPLVLAVVVAGAVLLLRKDSQPLAPGEINYGPPTKEEARAGNDQKVKNVEREEKDESSNTTGPGSTSGSSKPSTAVVITDANQYDNTVEVRAFMPDHYEDGTCTITFTQGSLTVKKSTPAYRDATTTICTNPLFNRLEFGQAGNWQVVVTYDAASAAGSSAPKTVRIQ